MNIFFKRDARPEPDESLSFDFDQSRTLRQPPVEDSVTSDDSHMDDGALTDDDRPEFEVVRGASQRGRDILVERDGYTYNINRRYVNSCTACLPTLYVCVLIQYRQYVTVTS